jgi:hypothetical protein
MTQECGPAEIMRPPPKVLARAKPQLCVRGVTADALTLYAAGFQRPAAPVADASAAARSIATTLDSR